MLSRMTFETNQKNEELVTECFNSDKPVNSVNSWSNLLLVWVILCDINMSKLFNTILWYNVLTLYTVGFDMLLQYNGLKWDSERLKALIINNLLIWYPFWDYIMASFNRPEAMNTPKFIFHQRDKRMASQINHKVPETFKFKSYPSKSKTMWKAQRKITLRYIYMLESFGFTLSFFFFFFFRNHITPRPTGQ